MKIDYKNPKKTDIQGRAGEIVCWPTIDVSKHIKVLCQKSRNMISQHDAVKEYSIRNVNTYLNTILLFETYAKSMSSQLRIGTH